MGARRRRTRARIPVPLSLESPRARTPGPTSQGGVEIERAVWRPPGRMDLVIENLSKSYPNGVQALHDVTLTIRPGMFGLLGPNGAGKSTLMRTLATLQEPDTGSRPPRRHRRAARQGRGAPAPRLPAAGVRRLPEGDGRAICSTTSRRLKGLADRRARKETVEALLHQTNLWDARQRAAGQLLRRHEAALRHRPGAARRPAAASSSTSPPRASTPRSASASTTCSRRSARASSCILSTHIVERRAPTSAAAWRSSTRARCCWCGEPARRGGRAARTALASASSTRPSWRSSPRPLRVISTRLVAGRTLMHVLRRRGAGARASSRSSPTWRTSTSPIQRGADLAAAGGLTMLLAIACFEMSSRLRARLHLRLLRHLPRRSRRSSSSPRAAPSPAPPSTSAPAARSTSTRPARWRAR